jgi:hypothetical protein
MDMLVGASNLAGWIGIIAGFRQKNLLFRQMQFVHINLAVVIDLIFVQTYQFLKLKSA